MSSKSDRRDYMKEYNAKRKEKRKEYDAKRNKQTEEEKQAADLVKYQAFKSELENTIKNNSWYNPDRNPYLNRLPGDECEKYNLEKKKRFFLQYDMDHLYLREKGDSKKYLRNRELAFNKWYLEKDLFHRIKYFRIFRREFKKRWNGEEPDKTNQMMNNCFLPSELNPESSDFRADLLHLLEEGIETDPKMKVLTPPEWAQKLVDEDSSDSDFDE